LCQKHPSQKSRISLNEKIAVYCALDTVEDRGTGRSDSLCSGVLTNRKGVGREGRNGYYGRNAVMDGEALIGGAWIWIWTEDRLLSHTPTGM
jgi:hypothetical protein